MTIEFVQEQWTWWGPVISDKSGLLWVSGVTIPANAPPTVKRLEFPDWMPQKFFISFCRATHQGGGGPSATGGQFAIIKDPGCVYFKSSGPPNYQDGDHSRIHTLSSIWIGKENERNMCWNPPVFFDRTADSLRVQMGLAGTDMCNFQLGFLRPFLISSLASSNPRDPNASPG
jgi:hypothetical protein